MKTCPGRACLFATTGGGVRTFSIDLANALGRAGWHVAVVVPRPESKKQQDYVDVLNDVSGELLLLPFGDSETTDLGQLCETFERASADVLVPNCRRSTYAACAMLRRRGGSDARIVGVCHNDHESYYGMLSRFSRIIDAFVCPTDVMVERLRSRLPKKSSEIELIPHAVECPREPRASYRGDTIRCIYHGGLTAHQKQSRYLIDLAERLKSSDIPFVLVIVGDGPCRADMQADALRRDVDDVIEFRGEVTQREALWEILDSCHIAVLTSRYEAFCYSLAEAMGRGLVGVAFACGGVIESYLHNERNGYIVGQRDVDAMARRIVQMQGDRELWQVLSSEAHRTVQERFSFDQFRESYDHMFVSLANSDRPLGSWPVARPVLPHNAVGRVVEGLWRYSERRWG